MFNQRASMRLSRPIHSSVMALAFVSVLGLLMAPSAFAADHSIGVGAHFWKTLDDIADDLIDDGFDNIEEDGLTYVLSWKIEPQGIFFFQLDAEYYEDGFAGATDSGLAPALYIGIGGDNWYGAAGLGATYSSDFRDDVSDPYWIGRIGREGYIVPGVRIDVYFDYRADSFEALEEASTDSITLGAVVRFNL